MDFAERFKQKQIQDPIITFDFPEGEPKLTFKFSRVPTEEETGVAIKVNKHCLGVDAAKASEEEVRNLSFSYFAIEYAEVLKRHLKSWNFIGDSVEHTDPSIITEMDLVERLKLVTCFKNSAKN